MNKHINHHLLAGQVDRLEEICRAFNMLAFLVGSSDDHNIQDLAALLSQPNAELRRITDALSMLAYPKEGELA
ncbi:MAG: hypothetical protein ACOYBQ_02940 [Fluviibacter sp.]